MTPLPVTARPTGLGNRPRVCPDIARGQKIVGEVCAACHGADGNSPLPANPKLAAQIADYTAKQLADYKANKDRKNPVMMAMAAPLSDDDMRAVAAFFASQKPRPGAARNKETVSLGQKLYRGGNAASGVPACSACHGPTGAGTPRPSGTRSPSEAVIVHGCRINRSMSSSSMLNDT